MKAWRNKRALDTQHVNLLVFDEADEMLKVIVFLGLTAVQLLAVSCIMLV